MYPPYAIESNPRRLADAIVLGIFLGSQEYQYAAMKEFLPISMLLDWPEDYVNQAFEATQSVWYATQHPARKMIVAVVAEKKAGKGKRRARQGPREANVERGDRIMGTGFWETYDRYVRERGGGWGSPGSVEEFM